MIYRDKTNLVINDKYICDFIDKVNSEDFLQMIESVIKNICMVSDTNLKRDSSQLEMINCLNGFKREFTDIIYNSLDKIDLSKITNVINENRVNDMISNERIVENVQRIVSKGSEINTLKIDSIFHKDKLEEINGNMLVMKHILSEIKNYHETKKEHEKCSNQKGKTGENIVFDMLENTLPSKEYTILDCSKKGHSCDILIKRINIQI